MRTSYTKKRLAFFTTILAALLAVLAAPGTALAAPGDLIPAFGTGGVVTNNPSGGSDQPYDMVINASGIYLSGADASLGNDQWRIEKRNLTTGALIPAFGTGGVVTENPSGGSDIAYDIAIDATAIYVAGGIFLPAISNGALKNATLQPAPSSPPSERAAWSPKIRAAAWTERMISPLMPLAFMWLGMTMFPAMTNGALKNATSPPAP